MNTGDKKEPQQKVFRPFSPLTDPNDDQLGFAPFAEHIARSIVSFGYEENIAISINGAWGSGKTTFLGFVKHYINQFKGEDSKINGNEFIIVDFKPWLVMDQNQLINEFFSTLNKALKSKVSRIDGSLLTKTISEYVSLLEPVPLVGSYAKSVGGALKVISDKLEKNLNDKKEELRKILDDIGFKIIFFIDDLDRLFPKEMYLIFQLIKSILDFPNIIYVVAFDSDYVCNSLKKEFNGLDAQEYLEKIFQIPFHIPQSSCDNLSGIVMGKIIEKYSFNDKVAQKDIYDLFKLTRGLFKTYRNTVRFLETISLVYSPVRDDVYLVDFIGIEFLRIFHPDVHKYIHANIDYLANEDFFESILNKNKIIEICSYIDNKCDDQSRNLVYFLFPDIDDAKFHPNEQSQYKPKVGRHSDKSKRACVSRSDKYSNYFKFNYVSPTIKQSELDEIEENLNNKEIIFKMIEEKSREEIIPGCYKSSDIFKFLIRQDIIDKIDDELIKKYVSFLHDKGDRLALTNIGHLKSDIGDDLNRSSYILLRLYNRINENFDFLLSNIRKTNHNNILINVSLAYFYCDYITEKKADSKIITLESLERLKAAISKKIKEFFTQENWLSLDYSSLARLVCNWLEWDKINSREWFFDIFSKDDIDSATELLTRYVEEGGWRGLEVIWKEEAVKFLVLLFDDGHYDDALVYIEKLKQKNIINSEPYNKLLVLEQFVKTLIH